MPETEFRPYIAMSRLVHSPDMPSWPHLVMSVAAPHLRPTDIAARYGGEEFLIGLPHTDAEQAFAIMDRIRQDFSQIRHPFGDQHFLSTTSGGIATYPLYQDGDSLIKAADEALYQAKRHGRNRIHTNED